MPLTARSTKTKAAIVDALAAGSHWTNTAAIYDISEKNHLRTSGITASSSIQSKA